jgi:hypothetical protein
MSALKLDKYGGMLPAWDSRLLPDGQADFSLNCYLFSGALTGWRQPKLLRTLRNSAAQFVYRIPNRETQNTAILAEDSFWMEFADPDTTIFHSPVVQDEWQRYYWASPSTVARYNTYDRIVSDQHDWILGVPASGCTPGVTVSGGGDTMQVGYPTVRPEDAGISDYRPGNGIFLTPIVPTGSMLIESVSFVPASSDGALSFEAVVYSDLNGVPYQLLGTGAQVVGISAGSAATSSFTNGVSVISNVTYWVGIAHDAAFYLTVADTRINNGAYVSNTYSNGPPNPAAATGHMPVWQMYGNLLGASVFEARGYVYTWVTEYGEEGPPSEPTVVNGWSNATWTIECFMPLPENMGADWLDPLDSVMKPASRNITKTRIYRTISNQSGMGSYFFVAEIPVTQAVYVDTQADNVVALNSQLVSLYWFGPPEDLAGIASFPNGIAVGYRTVRKPDSTQSNEIWFSEAYRPHAWPPGYVLTCEFPVVGIAVAGQSIVVCTQGTPYLINGVNPASMAITKVNILEPCLHRGSIVPTDTAVFYVSQNGLVQVSQSGAGLNTTEGWVSREKWQALVPQQRIRAVKHTSSYFAFGAKEVAGPIRDGFTVELSSEDKTSFTIWPQAGGHRLGFNNLSSPNEFDILNVQLDPWTGVCLLVQNEAVYYYDFTDQHPIIVPYVWRSKTYQQMARRNFEAMRLFFSVPDTTAAQVARDVTFPQLVLGDNQYGIVRVYVDGELWTTREIRTTGELLRIFSGTKGEQWQFEIEGRILVSNMQVATSVKELALV